jgi:IMP dehydrogenase
MANADKFITKGLTYDDVLVLPGYSQILPFETNLTTNLSRNIKINIPIVSAAMDTVTDSRLAIAIAREGGMGMIHKNMPIESQADEVRRVKRSESGMIQDPITLNPEATIGEALEIMRVNKIGGIPIVNGDRKLAGIITNRDLRFENNMNRKIAKVMTSEYLITAPEGIDLKSAKAILQKHKIEKLPVVDKSGTLKGLITFKDIKKVTDHPLSCKDQYGRLRVGAAIGIAPDHMERIEALIKSGVDIITLDTAHGHSKGVIDTLKRIKQAFPDLDVIAGNVATAEGSKALVDAGADAVKVGVGPGSICTTRVIAGIGVPQLTAIYEASKSIKGSGVPVVADGGIKHTGDIVKAIAAGADSVMAGSLFAGVEEAPGETVIFEGRKFKTYRGMGSAEAMKAGSGDRYFQDPEDELKKLVPEGIVGRVPYKGTLAEVVYQYVGGIRAGMGYTGSKDIKALKKAKFVVITASGIRESHPHDVVITKESSNYSPS